MRDDFINALKRIAIEDETAAIAMIDATNLSEIIDDQRTFGLCYHALSQKVLSHLFSVANFIPNRFFTRFSAARMWLLDNSCSSEHRLFLFKFYQSHFIQLLQTQPFTCGILSTLLSFFVSLNEKDAEFIKEIMQMIKPNIINLLTKPDILPALRCVLLFEATSDEFTLLIREIPEAFDLLCAIEDPKFFPEIQFEKLSPEQTTTIKIKLDELNEDSCASTLSA